MAGISTNVLNLEGRRIASKDKFTRICYFATMYCVFSSGQVMVFVSSFIATKVPGHGAEGGTITSETQASTAAITSDIWGFGGSAPGLRSCVRVLVKRVFRYLYIIILS